MHLPHTSLPCASRRARSTIMLDKLMLSRCPNGDMAVPYLLVVDMADERHHPPEETEEDR